MAPAGRHAILSLTDDDGEGDDDELTVMMMAMMMTTTAMMVTVTVMMVMVMMMSILASLDLSLRRAYHLHLPACLPVPQVIYCSPRTGQCSPAHLPAPAPACPAPALLKLFFPAIKTRKP